MIPRPLKLSSLSAATLIVAGCLVATTAPRRADAATIVPSGGSLFADHSALSVGDIVTVLIVESATATKSTVTRTNVKADHSASSLEKLDFIGMWGMNADNRSVGEGTTARRGDLQARITVEIKEKTLTIKGVKKTEEKKEDRKYHRVETHYGSFERSFYLPDNIDEENVKASFKNGLLKMSIPKVKEESAVKKVDIAEE